MFPRARRSAGNEVTRDMNDMMREMTLLAWRMENAAFSAMSRAQNKVYADAVNTTAYDDDTGATRNSTTTYVSDGKTWPHPDVATSRNTANAFRPDSGAADNAPPPPPKNWIVLDLITSTNYSYLLNIRFGGRSMFIANAILGNGGAMMSMVENAVREVFASPSHGTP